MHFHLRNIHRFFFTRVLHFLLIQISKNHFFKSINDNFFQSKIIPNEKSNNNTAADSSAEDDSDDEEEQKETHDEVSAIRSLEFYFHIISISRTSEVF